MRKTASPNALPRYVYEPNGDALTLIEPSLGSSVATARESDCASVPEANFHWSNEASEPVAVPLKMYRKPASGGGATYWASATAGVKTTAATAKHPDKRAKP